MKDPTIVPLRHMFDKISPTPMLENDLTDIEKKNIIEEHFKIIMETLGLDLTDDSLKDTPKRVAKMFVEEIFYGLDEKKFPKMTVVENKFKYDHPLIETNIISNSCCEHHFVPILGKCHVAYRPGEKVIGLSKLNRIVDYFSRRPQVQERLTIQIHEALCHILDTRDVAVVLDGMHSCVKTRGIKDVSSMTRTSKLSGIFAEDSMFRQEFMQAIPRPNEIHI
ncbi:MAG: GTP cyclohydrolase I FolE [Bacteriovorax sp.]|nr:GTP cyclohydrolase I FolE [Bacteriovorax sp.]